MRLFLLGTLHMDPMLEFDNAVACCAFHAGPALTVCCYGLTPTKARTYDRTKKAHKTCRAQGSELDRFSQILWCGTMLERNVFAMHL
jgi:hypothetical protein